MLIAECAGQGEIRFNGFTAMLLRDNVIDLRRAQQGERRRDEAVLATVTRSFLNQSPHLNRDVRFDMASYASLQFQRSMSLGHANDMLGEFQLPPLFLLRSR